MKWNKHSTAARDEVTAIWTKRVNIILKYSESDQTKVICLVS